MRKIRCSLGLSCGCVVAFLLIPQAYSQFSSTLPKQSEIESEDWATRRDAFATVIGLEPRSYSAEGAQDVGGVLRRTIEMDEATADTRKLILIDILHVETGVTNEKRHQALAGTLSPEERLSEEYVNYYGDVIAAVSSLGDPRSLQALLGAITTGNMVVDSLASFGSAAVGPIVMLLESSDSGVRSAATLTLVRILERFADLRMVETVRGAMKRAAADPDPFVRIRAVQGLTIIGDNDSVALVEEIAQSDPYQAEHREGQPYIVRQAAVQALKSR
jgi:HEAT repeat protein